MKNLEQIDPKTCANKIRVMKEAYIPLQYQRCKDCKYYQSAYVCHLYIPFKYYYPKIK